MSFIPYSEFKTNVKAIVFPDGEAEELVATHDSYIKDALINLQTYVPCLRDNNVDFYGKDEFQEWCNTDFAYIQRGVIHAVYAFKPDKRCKKIFYEPKSTSFVDSWMQKQSCVTCNDEESPSSPARSPLCNVVSDADSYCDDVDNEESDCRFKSGKRYYAISTNDKLILAPRFPCGYTVAVHWEGVKRKWADTDPVPDDVDLQVAVAKYMMAQRAIFLDRDTNIYDRIMHPKLGEFTISRADLIHRCTRERRIQERHQALDGMDVLQPFFYDPLPEKIVFAMVGDYGDNDSERDDVADLIAGWVPEFIVTTGDNWYGDDITLQDLIDRTGTVYEGFVASGNFHPTIGNHDRVPVGHLSVEKSHFGITGKEYYTFKRGLVQFFIIDSGYDDTQTNQQADGVIATSIQAYWLRDQLAASTARYKVVVLHHPPYTSFETAATGPTLSNDGYLAYPELRWPFLEWGASVVVNGHIHAYERIVLNNFLYITNGSGGRNLATLGDAIDGSQLRYDGDFGAIRGTASIDKLTLEFITRTGLVIDTVVIGGTGTVATSGSPIVQTGGGGMQVYFGTFDDPNGNVIGNEMDLYKNTTTGEMWVKSSGTGTNTGWI